MRAARVRLTAEHVMAGDPSDRRRTAVALAVTEVTPPGVMVVDHGDAVSYRLPAGWVTAPLPEGVRGQMDGFRVGRDTAAPVIFDLPVPDVTETAVAA